MNRLFIKKHLVSVSVLLFIFFIHSCFIFFKALDLFMMMMVVLDNLE